MSDWSLTRGANVHEEGGVRFEVWAPRAKSVRVTIPDMPGGDIVLDRRGDGIHAALIPNAGAGMRYAFSLDGGPARPDPVSRHQPDGVHGHSVIVDPLLFEWSDADWRGLPMAEYVLYELHVGTFTPEGTFDAVIPRLEELAKLGITAIELMPVAQFPGSRNWGYDGVQPYAVQASYGGPEGLRRLVDSAHRHGIAVVLDVVYNHLGPEGNYLGEFGPYFTDKYHTPWGSAINYDDRGSDEVRRLVVDNARYWISEYHIDGLRLDAIHGIFDFSPRHVLADVADAARSVGAAQGRTVVVIGESDMNDPRVLRDVSQGGYGLDGQWADDLHHAIHASLTGETRGYYSDFGQAAQVADGFRTPFIFRGQHSPYRGRRHGAPAEGFSRDRFVVASQNHDQVGNRAAGDRLTTLLDPARLRLASALVLLSPYVPLLFMGEEYGETAPFQYFISHSDPELVKAVQQGRRREFESFGWADDVPDPQAEDTFRRSKLNWDERNRGDHARIMAMYRDLLRLRRMEPALRPGQSAIEVLDNGRAFAAMMKPEGAKYLLAVFNVSDSMMKLQLPGDGWRTIFDAHDEAYGAAAGMKHPRQLRSVGGAVRCELRPYAALLLEPEHA